MADTISESWTLKLETIYTDADMRTINVPNPRSDISSDDISELSSFLADKNMLIGDKTGAQFGRITKATKILKQTYNLDISGE